MTTKRKPYGMTTPCPKCPFRNDIPAYLTRGRVLEIERSLDRGNFPCHLTTTHDDEEESDYYVPTGNEVHCAGALILMEKEDRSSQMMRIAERLGFYDHTKLNMDAPVFDSFDEMIEAQPARRK